MNIEPFRHLIPGNCYTIVKPFTDYDGKVHQPGGIYTFMGSDFLPHEDGLALRFTFADEATAFRLQWRAEAQMGIIESLEEYFAAVL